MNKLIVIENSNEVQVDYLISNYTCISNNKDIVIPYDCLEQLVEGCSIPYKIVQY